VIKKGNPQFSHKFRLPTTHDIVDNKLAIGAILFGLGLGLTGMTPATGTINAPVRINALYFFLSMLGGHILHRGYSMKFGKTRGD